MLHAPESSRWEDRQHRSLRHNLQLQPPRAPSGHCGWRKHEDRLGSAKKDCFACVVPTGDGMPRTSKQEDHYQRFQRVHPTTSIFQTSHFMEPWLNGIGAISRTFPFGFNRSRCTSDDSRLGVPGGASFSMSQGVISEEIRSLEWEQISVDPSSRISFQESYSPKSELRKPHPALRDYAASPQRGNCRWARLQLYSPLLRSFAATEATAGFFTFVLSKSF